MDYMKAINAMTGGEKHDYIDITGVKLNNKVYNNSSCAKISITLDNVDYIVKLSGGTNGKDLGNIAFTYSNSAITEYLGSMVFKLYNIPVQDVKLAMRNGKVCVICRDFTKDGKFLTFREIKKSYKPGFFTVEGHNFDNELVEVLEVIRCHSILKNLPYEDFFWKMFIIDAVIGNYGRHIDNFGIIESFDKKLSIAPIHDNSDSFNPTWNDCKMMNAIESENTMKDIAYNTHTCGFTDCGKNINPFQYIEESDSDTLRNALEYVVKCNSINTITDWIKSQSCIEDFEKQFYCKLIELRLNKLSTSMR